MTSRQVRMVVIGVVLLVVLLVPMAVLAAPAGQPQIPHPLAGHEDCLSCHATGVGGAPAVPADHSGRTNATCTGCHTVAASAEATATATETAAATATETAAATATETAAATATAAATETAAATTTGSELPQSGAPFPMLLTAIAAGGAMLSGFGVRFLKK